MEKVEDKFMILSVQLGKSKCTTARPWSPNDNDKVHELLNAFIGSCTTVGIHIDIINSVIKDYIETVEDTDE